MKPQSAAPLTVIASLLTLLSPAASAEDHVHSTVPTAWGLESNVPLQAIQDRVANGWRPVDIEIEGSAPLRLSAVFVHNSGAYSKAIDYDHEATWSEVKARIAADWRVVDLEPYRTSGGQTRYAYVAIPNDGPDEAELHDIETGMTKTQVESWVALNPALRITDIQHSILNGSEVYSFCWVKNSGALYTPWAIRLDVWTDYVEGIVASAEGRVIDHEQHWSSSYCSLLMVPADNDPLDLAFRNLAWEEVQGLAACWGARVTDFERSRDGFGDTVYSVVLRKNENDLAFETALAMRERLGAPTGRDNRARSGLLLREYGAQTATLAGVTEHVAMEPGGLVSLAHHYTAFRKVHLGQDSLVGTIAVETGMNGSCPNGGPIEQRPFTTTLRDMMEQSDNAAIEAFRQRYGAQAIETFAAAAGATNLQLNHTVGCGCGGAPNAATLRDFADIFGEIDGGSIGALQVPFLEFMRNSENFGRGSSDTSATIDDLLNGSALGPIDRAALRNGLEFAHRHGSYTCNGKSHRAIACYAVVPFRVGCGVEKRRFFVGSWVNDAHDGSDANDAAGIAVERLFQSVLRSAIESWEQAIPCIGMESYGVPNMNSIGLRGVISSSGSRYLHLNDLRLQASGVPPGSVGLLLVSPDAGLVPNPGNSMGDLLLGGAIGRDLGSLQAAGSTGLLAHPFDLELVPTPAGPIASESGDRLHFQWWYRDQSPTGAPTSNFTNGLRVNVL